MKTYWYKMNFSECALTIAGPNELMDETIVGKQAELLAASWNRRHRARNCSGHEWEDGWCSKCGAEKRSWEEQELEEMMDE